MTCVITEPQTVLHNQLLEESIVPCEWKEAQISAIFEKGDTSLARNYRPVSLTSPVFKTMENLFTAYIDDNMK